MLDQSRRAGLPPVDRRPEAAVKVNRRAHPSLLCRVPRRAPPRTPRLNCLVIEPAWLRIR